MKSRINWDEFQTDPLHILRVLFVILIAAVFFTAISMLNLLTLGPYDASLLTYLGAPFILAGRIRAGEAISNFAGEQPVRAWTSETTIILATLLLTYIVGPTLLAWGFRARVRWRAAGPERGSPMPILLALALGGFLVFTAVRSIVGGPVAVVTYERMKVDDEANARRNALMDELSLIAGRAQILYYLPEEYGGGWKSVNGQVLLTIDKLRPSRDLLRKTLVGELPDPGNSFVMEFVGCDSLVIWGVGAEPGTVANEKFHNKDGRTGMMQTRVEVSPAQKRFEWEN